MYAIRIDGLLRPVLVTPKQLEQNIRPIRSPKGDNQKPNNRNNSLAIVFKLCEIYSIKYTLLKSKDGNRKIISLEIPSLKISVNAYGKTYNQAKRTLAFKTHREYCRLIICRTP